MRALKRAVDTLAVSGSDLYVGGSLKDAAGQLLIGLGSCHSAAACMVIDLLAARVIVRRITPEG